MIGKSPRSRELAAGDRQMVSKDVTTQGRPEPPQPYRLSGVLIAPERPQCAPRPEVRIAHVGGLVGEHEVAHVLQQLLRFHVRIVVEPEKISAQRAHVDAVDAGNEGGGAGMGAGHVASAQRTAGIAGGDQRTVGGRCVERYGLSAGPPLPGQYPRILRRQYRAPRG